MINKVITPIFLALLIASNLGHGNETKWACSEVSVTKVNELYLACGIGSASSESDARELARTNALKEFDAICNRSSDCKNHKINVNPKRNQCDLVDGSMVCRRAFEITVLDELIEDPNALPTQVFFVAGYAIDSWTSPEQSNITTNVSGYNLSLELALWPNVSISTSSLAMTNDSDTLFYLDVEKQITSVEINYYPFSPRKGAYISVGGGLAELTVKRYFEPSKSNLVESELQKLVSIHGEVGYRIMINKFNLDLSMMADGSANYGYSGLITEFSLGYHF